jgi:SsrA-binding protein
MEEKEHKTIATNRKARHEFEILETIEAGIALVGSEVKTLREGKANIQDSHARVERGEVWLFHMHIPIYKQANINNHDEYRARKLLLHKNQIRKLIKQSEDKGMTLVPLSVYFNEKNKVKVLLAVARGKKMHDKREAIARRDEQRSRQREFRNH